MAKYDFLSDSFSNNFLTYTPVELDFPLNDSPIDISDWASGISSTGIPIVRPIEVSEKPKEQEKYKAIINNTTETPITQETSSKTSSKKKITKSKGADTLSQIIDEVSNESGFEGLKNQNTKDLLMLQAQRESNYNPSARSKSSTASGYFQFIDSTRKNFTDYNREDFLNDPKEQVRTAYRHLRYILNTPNAQKMKSQGYNDSLITALGWWYPDSMRMVLNGNKDFSLGGYSIKQAFEDYG